jgi:hypothetical protein
VNSADAALLFEECDRLAEPWGAGASPTIFGALSVRLLGVPWLPHDIPVKAKKGSIQRFRMTTNVAGFEGQRKQIQ